MLILAQRDLKAAQNMMDTEKFDDAIFGFHAQQTVEKALKARLCLHGITYPKTHDIRLLFRLLEDSHNSVDEQFYNLADLTDFAVEFRYDILDDEPLNRISIVRKINVLLKHIEKLINDTVL